VTTVDVDEREHLAEVLASNTVPWLTYAVHMRDGQTVRDILTELTHQELLGLAVVLAERCPRPLMRPDDGDVDEVAVARACAGEPAPLSRLERLEAVRKLAAKNVGVADMSRLLNTKQTTVRRLLQQVTVERERDPEDVESERYAPVPAERGYWNRCTGPITSGQDND
jgi:hypothetical protein